MPSATRLGGHLLLLAGISAATPAEAQRVPMVSDQGPQVVVTLKDAAPVEGVLITLGDTSVTLLVNQMERTIPLDVVSRIERDGDRTRDGATKGAVILGLLCALVCGQGVSSGSEHQTAIASNAAIGALAGWAFDRGHRGRTRIYPPPVDWRAAFAHATPPATTPPAEASEPSATPAIPTTPDTPGAIVAPDQPEPPTLAVPTPKRHAISVSPFGLVLGDAAVEYERRVASWLGVGLAAARSTRTSIWVGREQVAPEARQVVTDAVARVYPGGRVFSGAALGLRAGVGWSAGDPAYGVGYDLAYTWQFDGFGYVSLGVGRERVYTIIPGFRPAAGPLWPFTRLNVGFVF